MNRIKELPKSSSQLLSSTQIISSVHSVVKELIENALDAFATNIEVKLEDFGLEKIEVKDNGKGIHKDDVSFIAKPHCTSKITSHLDLNKIESYGFRGEALAALSSVSELVVTTKTSDENFGFTYTFDHNGNVLTTKPSPCNQGTAVICTNLFKNIPVRRQFYRSDKNKKDELKKAEDILISFGCIQTGVRFTLFHNRNLIWQKPSVNKSKEGLVQIFGNAVMDYMENCEFKDDNAQINIEVFLPKLNAPLSCSQSSLTRSIVVINKRPVRMKIIDKLLKEYYNKVSDGGNKSRYPICYIAIDMPPSTIDVNFEPNKTAVAMEDNNLIVDQLTKILSTFYCINCDPQNDVPKNIQTRSLEKPQNKNERSSKITSELSNKNIAPTFQTKLAHLAPDFTKTKMSSKLSRGKDSDTPSSKRRRTSASFSTPSNDIQLHINTLKSFFHSEKDEDATAAKIDSSKTCIDETTSVQPGNKANVTSTLTEKTQSNGIAIGIEKRLQTNEISNFNKQYNVVSVQRAQSNETSKLNDHCNSASVQNIQPCEISFMSDQCTTVNVQRAQSSDASSLNDRCNPASVQNIQPCEIPLMSDQCTRVTVQRAQSSDASSLNDRCNPASVQNIQPCEMPLMSDECTTVTVQRAQSSDNRLNDHYNSASVQNVQAIEVPLLGDQCTTVTVQREKSNEILEKTTYFPPNESIEFVQNEKNMVSADKVRTELEAPSRKKLVSDSCKNGVKNLDEVSSNSMKSSPNNTNEWSRGLHSVEIQPVAVLKPKVTRKYQDQDGTVKNVEILENNKEFNEISPNGRKITPFDFFCRKQRLEVASLNPNFSNHQIAQILTEKWNHLSVEEKAVYKNMVSKDYPKSIQNKENLGKVISESLSKAKDKTRVSKKVVKKMKQKYKERSIIFNMELITNHNSSPNSGFVNEIDMELNVMSCLTPGAWICSQQHKLYVLNCYRLQETIVYHRLLETYQFEPEPLESPFILTSHSLGDSAMNVLSQMSVAVCFGNEYIISDKNLIANGFKIRLLKGEHENYFEAIGMAQNIAFYGVPDLKEILLNVQKNGFSVKLEKCRPQKAILYLQGEAVRIARQYHPSKNLEDIEELLEKKKVLSSNVCIHSKPILQEIFTIPTE